jgi:succinyl-CoA synthetase alpha subunit
MRVSREMETTPGVQRAAAMMGTPQNLALLREAGLLTAEGDGAGPSDLVLAVLADDPEAARAAMAAGEAALVPPTQTAGTNRARPRSLETALRRRPDSSLALISVPGVHAGHEARKALRAGLDVMLFSDNVPLAMEVALKRLARERGRFLMGPDCGTAIINGVPLGFANAVPRGRIGIAAASGTGLQEVACLIAAGGEGISHAIGVGGRDLCEAVGGLMMESALEALAADAGTAAVCIAGKPVGSALLERLAGWAERTGKPCVAHFPRTDVPGDGGRHTALVGADFPRGGWHVAATLENAAHAAIALARGQMPMEVGFGRPAGEISALADDAMATLGSGQRFVRGVYAGGTLAWEAVAVLSSELGGVAPTVAGGGEGHRVVDLGQDDLTVGRPHPMIDGAVRREWIGREGRDPGTAVLLLDVVLGHGAHRDPAGEVLPALRAAREARRGRREDLVIVASVCGTDADPQNRSAQVRALEASGVIIMPSNAQAARLAALIGARLAARAAP